MELCRMKSIAKSGTIFKLKFEIFLIYEEKYLTKFIGSLIVAGQQIKFESFQIL